jgi:hypothetical protein
MKQYHFDEATRRTRRLTLIALLGLTVLGAVGLSATAVPYQAGSTVVTRLTAAYAIALAGDVRPSATP